MKKQKPDSGKKSKKQLRDLPKPKGRVTAEQARSIKGGDEGSPDSNPTRLPPPPPPGG